MDRRKNLRCFVRILCDTINLQDEVGFEVLTAVNIALMMEAANTSETLVNFYHTTRRYNPEDSHLQFTGHLFF
jgi:hypothetical protein